MRKALALHADIVVRKARVEEEAARRKPMLVSSCTWTERDFEVFSALAKSAEYAPNVCFEARKELVIAPEPTADRVLKLFAMHDIGLAPDPPRPAWLGAVVSRRSQFEGTALCYSLDGVYCFAKFLHAKQQPQLFACAPLVHDVVREEVARYAFGSQLSEYNSLYFFRPDYSRIIDEQDLAPLDAADVYVLQGLHTCTGGVIRSSHSPIPLKEFIGRFYVDPSRGTASSGDDNNRKSSKSVKKELPWLMNDLKLKKARINPEKRHVMVLDGNASSEDEEYVDDDGVVEDMFEALRARHLADAPAVLIFRDGFKIVATSDRRSRSHVEGDRSLDGLQAHAFGNEAIDFCKTQIIRESSSFDVSTYGAELAGLLARGWCDRMNY